MEYLILIYSNTIHESKPFLSHLRCEISSPWAHLLNRGFSRSSCLLTIWPRKDLNFARITLPFPLGVVVALQCKWFTHGWIHSDNTSNPFSLDIFVRTLRTSEGMKKILLRLIYSDSKCLKNDIPKAFRHSVEWEIIFC